MLNKELFRKEVIEYQRRRLWGEVFVDTPLSSWYIVGALSAIVTTILIYFLFGSFSRSETVLGFIAPIGGVSQLYLAQNGSITAVFAAEGDHVEKGQKIIEYSVDREGSSGPLNGQLGNEAKNRLEENDKQLAYIKERYAKDSKLFKSKIEGIREDISDLSDSIKLERAKLKIEQDDLERWQQLLKDGNASQSDVSARMQSILSQTGTIQSLERQREGKKSDLEDSAIVRDNIENDYRQKVSQLYSAKSEITANMIQLDFGQDQVLSSPLTGTIVALQAVDGQSVTNTIPVAAIVRDGDSLEAQLLVPTRASGFLQSGQEVKIKLDAFPYQRFGILKGTVSKVSHTVYRPGELLAPVAFQEPVYRLTVSLDDKKVAAYGKQYALQPGMTLSAEVIVERRNFADWVLDPLRTIAKSE